MAAIFFDIDGTVVNYHTNDWLPGVVDKLTALNAAGHQVIFISMRGLQDHDMAWNIENTLKLLATLPFKARFIDSVQSPRILIDDVRPAAVQTACNSADWIGRL